MHHSNDVSEPERAYWEAQLPAPLRPSEREIPVGLLCGSSLLQDLADRKPTIAERTLSSLRGTKDFKLPSLPDPDIPHHGASPELVLSARGDAAVRARCKRELPLLVHQLLGQLPEKQRAVLRLRFGISCEAMPVHLIALSLGCSRKHIWEVEQRAMSHLRPLLGVEGAGAPAADTATTRRAPVHLTNDVSASTASAA